ncbi:MAG TPA: DUF1501 domain-containing protein [Lacipirellulaceae bacterium]|nr:DUF1501 domain-containing protein [Lacipirellulaceae bacterium]HMP05484.1 DUF1501 domain-containing protein [Lacipirellulaceae bacterium]
MIDLVGRGVAHTCDGACRRDFLKAGALGALGFSLPQYFAAKAVGAVNPARENHACIMIFNLGAPSQLDTFDMKPEAPAEIRGPFKPMSTAVPGTFISEILPRHAAIADKFSLVRSCHHQGAAVHDAGWQIMQTGRQFRGGIETPHAGSVISYLRGRKTDLPPFVVLPERMGRGGANLPNGQAGGFLGKAHDPFALMADPSQPNFRVPDLLPPPEIGAARMTRRMRIRDVVNSTLQHFEQTENAKLLDESFAAAFRLMTSPEAREAFDLTKEPAHIRDRYGMNRLGQCCLLARRLVEAGVRFVTVNAFLTVFDEITWDIHGSKPFTSIQGMKEVVCPMYDQAYSALISDLDERGLLAQTLVACLSEFGRTPKVNPAGGRDHWPQCFTCYFAGGGVQGGRVIGASDSIGAAPVERPVQPPDLVATIFHSLGLDYTHHLPGPGGRPFPLVDFGHQHIHELF